MAFEDSSWDSATSAASASGKKWFQWPELSMSGSG